MGDVYRLSVFIFIRLNRVLSQILVGFTKLKVNTILRSRLFMEGNRSPAVSARGIFYRVFLFFYRVCTKGGRREHWSRQIKNLFPFLLS